MITLPVITVSVTIALLAWFGLQGNTPAPIKRKAEHPIEGKDEALSRPVSSAHIDPSTIMQFLVFLPVLGSALFIILSGKYTPQDQHWAYGIAGTIIGFWSPKRK